LTRTRSLASLRRASRDCRNCELWRNATQTVFGEGPSDARLMLVGEQPGDQEDRQGKPFVGPAGGMLDRALAEAEIDSDDVYVTNAVKHFKWRPAGKRRLHQTPRAGEGELEAIEPRAVMALGATAAKALFGPKIRVTRDRGRLLESPIAPVAAVTVHPSAILRARDSAERADALAGAVEDLRLVRDAMRRLDRTREGVRGAR
jgi:uracil-DNA glycosylase